MSYADDWNAQHPVGTPVRYWSLTPIDADMQPETTKTRTPAWTLGSGVAVVSVDGHTGGVALTHVEVIA